MTETPTRDDVDRALRSVHAADSKPGRGPQRYCPNCDALFPSPNWDGWKCPNCGTIKQPQK